MANPEKVNNPTSKSETLQTSADVVRIPLGVNLVGYPAMLVISEEGVRTEIVEVQKKEDK